MIPDKKISESAEQLPFFKKSWVSVANFSSSFFLLCNNVLFPFFISFELFSHARDTFIMLSYLCRGFFFCFIPVLNLTSSGLKLISKLGFQFSLVDMPLSHIYLESERNPASLPSKCQRKHRHDIWQLKCWCIQLVNNWEVLGP